MPAWRGSMCSTPPGRTPTSARPTCSRTTSTTTGGSNSPQYQWLKNDLETHPRALRFAFHHFPLYSDQSSTASDTWLQGANSLEGLLKLHDVTVDFSAHSHNYQRNSVPAGGVPTYVSGGGGANLESIGGGGCSANDLYGLGWSNTSNVGSACGAGPVPATKDRVHHFLLVSVNGTSVTVTPTDELGRTFDPVTYNAPAQNANLSVTKQDTPDPVLVGQQVTYNLDVGQRRAARSDRHGGHRHPARRDDLRLRDAVAGHLRARVRHRDLPARHGWRSGSTNHETIQIKGRPQSTGTINNTATVASSVNDPSTANNTSTTSTTVNPSADLAVTKTDSPDPVAQGSELTYTVGVSNAGPSTATGITLTDTLPAGVTFNSATPTQGSCSHTSGTVSCSLGNLANTANASVAIKVTPQSVATITNQANVVSLTGDPNTANNGASVTTTVNASANLSLTKSDAPDPVLVGQPLTYSLTTQNAGPSAAPAVQLTDTLPAEVTFNSATPSQGSCSHSSGTVTCALGTIASGANATVSIQVTPQAQGSITNQASVTTTAIDPVLTNNSASATTLVNPVADLVVTKTDAPDPALVGQPLTYTVGVQNSGPSSAPTVSMTDTLPAGVTFNSAVPSQGSCTHSAGTVTCPLGTIANSASASIQITVTPQSTGSITNQASASSSVSDPNSANSTASAATLVNPSANLSLTKTDSPDPVLQGEELTYTLTASNAGPSSATSVVVTDTLPAGVTYNSGQASQGSCTNASGTVTCTLGTIASGANATVTIKVTPPSTGSITNQASVTSAVSDPSAANNTASASTLVNPVADLSITKSDSPDPVSSGQQLTYAIGVHNSGPSGATGVTVTDTLPGGVTYDSATPSQGSCSHSSGTVTCNLGALANGANATVNIVVTPSSGTSITNQASVSAATADPAVVNNAASATTTVDPVADLSLTNSDAPDPVLSGNELTYTLAVNNAGPASAPSTSLSDTLPAGQTFVSATTTQGSCARSGNTVICALGTLASGANATVTIKVNTGAPDTITNDATVLSTATDPNTANNSASAVTTVKPVADLALTKSDAPDPVLAGQLLTYTLGVSNGGPQDAPGVTVTDTLPSGVTFDSATATQGGCSQSAGTVTCALGTVTNGNSAGVEIKVRPQSEGTITNQASVTSGAGDLNTSNDSASAQTTVDPAADLELTKTDSADPVLFGDELTYTLAVHNAGPSAANGVALSDTLPTGVTFVSLTTSQGSCFSSGISVLCSLGTLADESNATVQITVTANEVGTLSNSANVFAMTADTDPGDNAAGADTTVNATADLSLTKSDSPDPVSAGDLLTYSLGVHNGGPQDATAVVVTDTLPAGVLFESATSTQGTCSESSGVVTCALGTIANGADAGAEVKVRPQEGGQITNQASVDSAVADQAPGNNSASTDTTVNPGADLSLTKSDSPDPILAGELLTYTLGIHNAGPSSATTVEVTDTLPAGVTFDSADATQGTCSESAGTVTCALGTLADEADESVEIKVRPQASGTITNQASVSSGVQDPSSPNNSASAQTTVDPAADLSLTKTGAPDPVLEGDQLTYALTVANAGPHDATGVTLTDTLPAGVTFDSVDPAQGSCSESSGTVTCALGTIADGASVSVEIKVTPQGPGTLTNQASVSSDVADPDSADLSASVDTTVDPVADLSLTKSDAPDPVLAGEPLTYTLTVDNAGPRSATAVELTDTLPSTVTFGSATPSQGSCSHVSGTVTCALDTIADEGSASVVIEVTPQEGGTITNEATVSAAEGDPTPSTNSATAETSVNPAADLELTKTDSPDPVPVGGLLTYTLSVHNAGPSSAPAVQLTDTLPAGVTFESATPSQGTCSEAAGIVDCALGTLADAATTTVAIKVRPQSTGTITNQASVLSLALDTDPLDNNASAETTVGDAADLSLTKTGSPDPLELGQQLTYTLTVQNSGPDTATAVTLTDTLPGDVTFDSATPSQGSCTESSGTVTCDLGTLADEAVASAEIKVTPQSAGTIVNQASVSSAVADPDPDNSSATAETTVDPVSDLSVSQTDSPDPAFVGEQITYALAVHNSGPSSAPGVTLADTLPAGVTFESATASQGSCTEAAGTVSCALGAVADGSGATVTIRIRRPSAGTITNQATVDSDAADPATGNNTTSTQTTVNPVAGYARPQGASPIRVPLVPAYSACTTPNMVHGTPLDDPSCASPTRVSPYLTLGTPDSNGAPANSNGSIKLTVLSPSPSDVGVTASITDVRCGIGTSACGSANNQAGADYTGELQLVLPLRITDRLSGAGGGVPGTVVDTQFPVAMTCNQVASATIGSTCSVTTSANAVLPGSVPTGRRALWELDRLQVFDGGPDGLNSSAGNGLFAVQGVLIP